jgi:hypothetical protein
LGNEALLCITIVVLSYWLTNDAMVHDRVPDVERACSHSDEDMEEDTDEIIKRRERKDLSDRASRISSVMPIA